MATDFYLKALPAKRFQSFFTSSKEQLAQDNQAWIVVDSDPGFPCRVSLTDAKIGERVLALTFCHHDVNSPYKASGPIFVIENSVTRTPDVNEIPALFRHRLLSVRGYNLRHSMTEAQVTPGTGLSSVIQTQFENADVEYIHIHYANPGCFACAVFRVSAD